MCVVRASAGAATTPYHGTPDVWAHVACAAIAPPTCCTYVRSCIFAHTQRLVARKWCTYLHETLRLGPCAGNLRSGPPCDGVHEVAHAFVMPTTPNLPSSVDRN